MEARWHRRDRFVELQSHWVTLIGEHLEDDRGRLLEYWRVERADSAIVLPVWGDRILLPGATYRPGIGRATRDFPGGRIDPPHTAWDVARQVLQRELAIAADAIQDIMPLNPNGWSVDSSFSSQKLFGYVATLRATVTLPAGVTAHAADAAGVEELLRQLDCLQCRAVLQEWWQLRLGVQGSPKN